jgi:hypothetical protein
VPLSIRVSAPLTGRLPSPLQVTVQRFAFNTGRWVDVTTRQMPRTGAAKIKVRMPADASANGRPYRLRAVVDYSWGTTRSAPTTVQWHMMAPAPVMP